MPLPPKIMSFAKAYALIFVLQYGLLTAIPLLDNLNSGGPSKESYYAHPWVLLFVENPLLSLAAIALSSLAAALFYTQYGLQAQASHVCDRCRGKKSFYHRFWHCPNCDSFCENCGQAVSDDAVKCQSCGMEFEPDTPKTI